MPAPISPEVRRRALELTRAGHSSRAVSAILAKEGFKISYVTVTTIAKQSGGAPLPDLAPAPSPAPKAVPKVVSKPAPPPADEDEAPTVPPPLDLSKVDPSAVADMDLIQLAALAVLLQAAMETAIKNEDARAAGQMWALREKVSLAIARVRPPTPPDPAKDPANTAARDDIRERLKRLVLSARKSGAALELLRAHVQVAEQTATDREEAAAE